ncbi:aldo/keto reductase [Pontiellaceae bacterium B12227]|nr:aldo/keto reductase [Pontiellaceae bacterium B12227]
MNGSRRGFVATSVGSGLAGLAATTTEAKPQAKRVDRKILGKTGAEVSIYGLGLGSAFWKPMAGNPEGARKILERALDFGINYWDTAYSYKGSEELIGPVLKERRDEVFMVSKSNQKTYDTLMRELEGSLKRLQTDHLDLFHMHNWEPKKGDTSPKAREEAFKAVVKAKEQGMIRHFGVTGHSGPDILMECIKAFEPDALLTTFPANRPDNGRYEDELLAMAVERNIGVIAMKSVRHVRNSDENPTELMRYAMSLPGVHTTIIGTGEVAHVEANARLATNFQGLDKKARKGFSDKVAMNIPAGLPQPWDLPGYNDGMLA